MHLLTDDIKYRIIEIPMSLENSLKGKSGE